MRAARFCQNVKNAFTTVNDMFVGMSTTGTRMMTLRRTAQVPIPPAVINHLDLCGLPAHLRRRLLALLLPGECDTFYQPTGFSAKRRHGFDPG